MNAMVRDVMSSHPISVHESSSFKDLARKFLEFHGSAFVVLADDGKVIGVVSDADMLPKEALGGGDGGRRCLITGILHRKAHEKARGITAGDLMTSPAVTVGPDTPVVDAARLMRDRRFKRLPVVNATGHLIGIISRTDVLGVFLRPDKDILREVTDAVIPASGAQGPTRFTVTVTGGIITVGGRPENDRAGHELAEAIRRVEGVVAVFDQLRYAGEAPR